MRFRTPSELGALIRDYRIRHNLDQKSLAASVGVSRQWIIEIEKGKAGAPLGLVLRTLGALGIILDAQQETSPSRKGKNKSNGLDINTNRGRRAEEKEMAKELIALLDAATDESIVRVFQSCNFHRADD